MRESADRLGRTTVLESGKPLAQARGEWMVCGRSVRVVRRGREARLRTGRSRAHADQTADGAASSPRRRRRDHRLEFSRLQHRACRRRRARGRLHRRRASVGVHADDGDGWSRVLVGSRAARRASSTWSTASRSAMGQAMLAHPALREDHFTGSVRVGKLLMDGASKTVTRLSLELGGNAPVLVFPDVDIEQRGGRGRRREVPQRRTGVHLAAAVSRRRDSRRRVRGRASSRWSRRCASAPASEPDTQVGPLINAQQRDRVEGLVSDGAPSGARRSNRRSSTRRTRQGLLLRADGRRRRQAVDAAVSRGDFGPVHAGRRPSTTWTRRSRWRTTPRYGLAAYVWTNNLPAAIHAAEKLSSAWSASTSGRRRPWRRRSSAGRRAASDAKAGAEGLEEYLETKLVAIGGVQP